MRESYGCGLKTSISEADPGQGPGGPGPLIFGQTEARRAEKPFFQTAPLPLSQGLDDPPPPSLSEGVDPPLDLTPESQIRTNSS